jgi:phosphopantothenate---cysteine ligase (CTP)
MSSVTLSPCHLVTLSPCQLMKCLITAGNTLVPIDRVRCITNVFTGRTGTQIARHCCERGHRVTLLTSHPELASSEAKPAACAGGWTVVAYRTFDDLQDQMRRSVCEGAYDVIIHCAAVSDYLPAGIYAPAPGTRFRADAGRWEADGPATLRDRTAGKVKSDEPELWLRLVRAPKLVDHIRGDWSFRGILVKFKLEVDVTDEQLLTVAEQSRRQSGAELLVANTLEGMNSWAYLGPLGGQYLRVGREDLPARLVEAVERLHEEKGRG